MCCVAAALALTACTSTASETDPTTPAMETSSTSPAPTTNGPDTGNQAAFLAGYQLAYIWSDDYGSRQKEVVGFCPDGSFYLHDESMSSYTDGNNGHGASVGHSGAMYGTWKFEQRDGNYYLSMYTDEGGGEVPVQLYIDEYGDQRFVIEGRAYGYYGAAECGG